MQWQSVLPGVWRFKDSCNVYAVQALAGMLVIDAGTGYWLSHVNELPDKVVALALTHYFRDHAAGAAAAARAGIAVWVPEYERELLTDPALHFTRRENYVIYDNLWDLFAPIEGVEATGILRDYDKPLLAGLEVEIIPLVGVTMTQVGIAIRRPGMPGPVIFCGEAIHSPGRLARIAPLQYNYADLPGAGNCYYTAHALRAHKPAALLPSLGEPILERPDEALALLQTNMKTLTKDRTGWQKAMENLHTDSLARVTDHVWQSTHTESWNWFLISESGKALVIDYGYPLHITNMPMYAKRYARRPLLHSMEGLKKHFGIKRIDVALTSHFHDDHVCGIPILQRVFGTECWVPENYSALLAEPEKHCFPCDWETPIRIDRKLPLDKTVKWEEFTFHFAPMDGHTRFAALIGFEADGKRFAHTGDQYFFQKGVTDWANNVIMQNHVYRNGATLGGFAQSGSWLRKWRPDIVISGHQPAMHTDDAFFDLIDRWTAEYEALHKMAMPLGDDDVHFNVDSWGGWIWPYRTHLKETGPAEVTVTVRNPFAHEARLEVKLVGPSGWRGTGETLTAAGRAEVSCKLQITPGGPCRRQPFAVELTAEGRPFGQVAEALMTVGGREF